MSLRTLEASIDRARAISRPPHTRAAPNALSLIGSSAPTNLGGFGSGYESSQARQEISHFKGTVASAINVVARRISGQPFVVARVGQQAKRGRSIDDCIKKGIIRRRDIAPRLKRYSPNSVELLDQHPLYDLIENPNDLLLPSNLWTITVAYYFVTGRVLWLIDTDAPQIIPVPTTWATPVHEGDKLFAKWSIRPTASTEDPMVIDGKFVMNVANPDISNPFFEVTSAVAMNYDSILADESISTAQRVAFKNQINPSMAITVGEAATGEGNRRIKLEPHQRRQLIAWIRQEFAGAQKYGTPIVLDSIIRDVKNLQDKPSEIGFLESMTATQKQIFMGIGVPLSSAGITEGTNYASSAVADHTLVMNTVNPLAKLISEAITAWVVPLFSQNGEKLQAWVVPAEAYDPDLQIRRWTAARQSFCTARNEMRTELLGLPPIDGLDDVVVPAGFQSVPISSPITPVVGSPGASGQGSAQNGPPTDSADPENMRVTHDAQKQFRKDVRATWVKIQGEGESGMSGTMQAYFSGQVKSAALALRNRGDASALDADKLAEQLLPVTLWSEKLRQTIDPMIRGLMVRGSSLNIASAQRSYRLHRKVLMQLPPRIQDAIQQGIDNQLSLLVDKGLWQSVNETTKRDLSFVLQEGLQDGDTLRELADRVEREMGPEWAGRRALLVARTESGAALNAGHFAAQKELELEGIAYGAEWLAIIDNDTRQDHIDANGQIVKAGQKFIIGGFEADYPGDPNLPAVERCNCRCASIPVTEPIETEPKHAGRLNGFWHDYLCQNSC